MAESSNGIQAFALAMNNENHSSNINSSINYIWIKRIKLLSKNRSLNAQSPKIPFLFNKIYISVQKLCQMSNKLRQEFQYFLKDKKP